jgi:hypothetical protein
MFEALRLEIRYDHTGHMAACGITLTGEAIGTVARTSQERRRRARGAVHDGTDGAEAEPAPSAGMVCVAPPAVPPPVLRTKCLA